MRDDGSSEKYTKNYPLKLQLIEPTNYGHSTD